MRAGLPLNISQNFSKFLKLLWKDKHFISQVDETIFGSTKIKSDIYVPKCWVEFWLFLVMKLSTSEPRAKLSSIYLLFGLTYYIPGVLEYTAVHNAVSRWAGRALPHLDFWVSVNSIPTRGGGQMVPNALLLAGFENLTASLYSHGDMFWPCFGRYINPIPIMRGGGQIIPTT